MMARREHTLSVCRGGPFTNHSSARPHLLLMRPATKLLPLLAFATLAAPASAQFAIPAPRTCFSAAETRQKIAEDKLAEPFPLMRDQAGEHRAEAIGVKLCTGGEGLVYEIDLLRKDGRLIHVILDAATGKPVAAGRQ